jgi:hypothetical protein
VSCVLASHLLLERHVLLAEHVTLLVGLKVTHTLVDLYAIYNISIVAIIVLI